MARSRKEPKRPPPATAAPDELTVMVIDLTENAAEPIVARMRADEVPAWLKAWRSDTAEAPTEDPKRTAAAYEALMRGVCGGCGLRTLDADGKCRACGARKDVTSHV
jgi:mono/diheme cytochrome c family protein